MSFFHFAPESHLVCSLDVETPAANLSSSEGTAKGSEPLMSFFHYIPEGRLVCSLVVKTPAANLSSSEETAEGSEPTASTRESLYQVYSHSRSLTKFINYCVHFIPTINGEITVTPAEPLTSGRHKYNGVLPGAPRGS
jgi:hypothetical protein